MNILLTCAEFTEKMKRKIEEFTKKEGLDVVFPTDEQEVKIVPKNIFLQLRAIESEIIEKQKTLLLKLMEDFFEQYVIEFKKAETKIPSYVSFYTDSEYDDEGGTYKYLSDVAFFDEQKNSMYCDFLVSTTWGGGAEFRDIFIEEISDNISGNEIDKMFYYGEMIPIPRGV